MTPAFLSWRDAVSVAVAYARETGRRYRVFAAPSPGWWTVQQTAEPIECRP